MTVTPRLTRAASLVLIATFTVGCGSAAPSAPVSASAATPEPSIVATAKPTPLSRTASQAKHISEVVPALMDLSDPAAITAWINEEVQWLNREADTPTLNNYRVAVQGAYLDIETGTTDERIADHALDIIAEARAFPGVTLQ